MADDPAAQRRQRLERDVMRYLVQHPDAKDTVEGIMHWWLPDGGTRVKESEVGLVLESLVGKGWVTTLSRSQGAQLYGLARAHEREIREWLEN